MFIRTRIGCGSSRRAPATASSFRRVWGKRPPPGPTTARYHSALRHSGSRVCRRRLCRDRRTISGRNPMDISHLHLHVRDRRRASDFYPQWFGLDIRHEDDDITFLCGSRDFLLALVHDDDPAPIPAWFHLGIRLSFATVLPALLYRMHAATG